VTGIREPDMLTGMTERDWLIALDVFDAVQSSRGQRNMAVQRAARFLDTVEKLEVGLTTVMYVRTLLIKAIDLVRAFPERV
jgi:hypothetical protein